MMRTAFRRVAVTAAAATAFACCAALPSYADRVTLTAHALEIGKWPEGLAFAGGSVWVAESGTRSIAEIDLDGRAVKRHITVGRLPVAMTTFNDGAVYALVETDKLLWRQVPSQSRGTAIKGLPGCPDGLAAGDTRLWILTEPDCTSVGSVVVGLDPRNGSRITSQKLGEMDSAIAATPGKVWVAYRRGTNLSFLDDRSLDVHAANIDGAALQTLFANREKLFAGGWYGNQGIVAAVDPQSGRELQRRILDQQITQVTADDNSVVALGNKGEIYVLSARDLQLQRTITLTTQPFEPRAAAIFNNALYITNGPENQSRGWLLVVRDWRPIPSSSPAAINTPAPPPPPASAAASVANCPYEVVGTGDATGIWMYQDPDTSAPHAMAIPANSKGLVVDKCLTGWCHLSFRGNSGWVESSHIHPTCN